MLELSDAAVATSGTYERGAHIVDPHSGRAPTGVASVTIVGPRAGDGRRLRDRRVRHGDAGPRWTAGLDGFSALTIAGERVLTTAGLAAHRRAV